MSTLELYWDEAFLAHEPPAGSFSLEASDLLAVAEPHPDSPDRVRNIRHILEATLEVDERSVVPATGDELASVHDPAYLDYLREACETGPTRMNETTVAMSETYRATRHAAGAAIQVARRALDSNSDVIPYAPVRPSGHHAQPASADGFCFVNNVAVAAETVLTEGLADTVAILDWDVHHGNGTQEVFYDRDDVLTVSIHGDHGPWNEETHPQTGRLDEPGSGVGEGYSVNIPLPLGTGDEGYEYAFEAVIEPVLADFSPDLLLISAGQDADGNDPLGRNVLSPAGFHRLGQLTRQLAARYAGGHVGVVQEGGYQRSYLAFDTLAIFLGMGALDLEFPEAPIDPYDSTVQWPVQQTEAAREQIDDVAAFYDQYWEIR